VDRPSRLHVEKPWGSFDQYALNEACTVKILTCAPGKKLSLQKHSKRDELWIALDEGAFIELDGRIIWPAKGEEIWLPCGSTHRLACPGEALGPVRVLEISFGHFDEEDIERIQDDYGRV
jgi:mannose-1-phosphate guanylyltransferase/mannose-6-phosphate isomerase